MDRWMFIIAALFAVMWNTAVVLGQECVAGSAMFINGNWYCQPVKAITYRNFPGTGDYNKIVAMDEDTGHCQTERYDYSGSLSPLNEEVSRLFFSFVIWSFIVQRDEHDRSREETERKISSCPYMFAAQPGFIGWRCMSQQRHRTNGTTPSRQEWVITLTDIIIFIDMSKPFGAIRNMTRLPNVQWVILSLRLLTINVCLG